MDIIILWLAWYLVKGLDHLLKMSLYNEEVFDLTSDYYVNDCWSHFKSVYTLSKLQTWSHNGKQRSYFKCYTNLLFKSEKQLWVISPLLFFWFDRILVRFQVFETKYTFFCRTELPRQYWFSKLSKFSKVCTLGLPIL